LRHLATITLIVTGFFLLTADYSHSESSKIVIINKTKPSVVLIKAYMDDGGTSQGSGFLISKDGHVVTNWHVIDGSTNIIVKTIDGAMYEVKEVVSSNKEKDLVKIKLNTTKMDFPYLPLGTDQLKSGQEIIVVGNPLGLESSVSDGIISAIRKVKDYGEIIQITAPISKGSSGSPVVNMNGHVIGVATLAMVEGQNLNFAIPANEVLGMKMFEGQAKEGKQQYLKNINRQVQLKENAALKIVKEFFTEEPNEFNIEMNKKYKTGKRFRETNRYIRVDLQYLMPCEAKSQQEVIYEKMGAEEATKKEEEMYLRALGVQIAFYAISEKQEKGEIDEKEADEGMQKVFEQWEEWYGTNPDLMSFSNPYYRCDYRFKIYCSFFDASGEELSTYSQFVLAGLVGNQRKINVYPGEKDYTTFYIPHNAEYWYVWLSK